MSTVESNQKEQLLNTPNFNFLSNNSKGLQSSVKQLKSDSDLPKKICVICLVESPLKMTKNAFYFILKALFFPKIFMVMSRLFHQVGKTVSLER